MNLRFAFLLAVASPFMAKAADYDCNRGCRTDPEDMGISVCGDDGIMYLNECIAVCQGVKVSNFGPCPDGPASPSGAGNIDTAAVITMEDMRRFEKERFRLVTKRDPSKFGVPEDYEGVLDEKSDELPKTGPIRALRMTSDGFEYVAKFNIEDLPKYDKTEPDPSGNKRGRPERSLAVIGDDTRSLVTDTTEFPFRAIAEIDFSIFFEGGCTATMISRHAALTAGHCVYSYDGGDWNSVTQIAPGRYRSGFSTIEPYGIWSVGYMTTYESWAYEGKRNFDIGVIKMKPNIDPGSECEKYPGEVVGYVGIDRPEIGDSRLTNSRITGYPADKSDGEMWTSGQCSPGWEIAEENFGFHYCDTYGGNSGSAVLTTNNVALGDHAYGFSIGGVPVFNGACLMEGWMYDSVYGWAHDDEPPECKLPPDCPCDSKKIFLFRWICRILNRKDC